MADSEGVLDCGDALHVVTAAWKALDATNANGYRFLTIRLASDDSDIKIGVKDVNGVVKEGGPHLQADESWSWGPNAGTIRPSEIYIKGTAGDLVSWIGTKV